MKRVLPLMLILLQSFACSGPKGMQWTDPSFEKTNGQDISSLLLVPGEDKASGTSVFYLENGGESLLARLWLFRHAERSIDIQYYSLAKDITGKVTWDYILRAADRGVKVRVLIDDAATRTYGHSIRLMDSHENIEIRVYNAGLKLGRLDKRIRKLFENGGRIGNRMHNKAVIIDGLACITGGRNIANEYFDYDHKYNFRDRDVLLAGKAVEEVSRSFGLFWNDQLTVPYASLSGKARRKKYRDPERFDELHREAADTIAFSRAMRKRAEEFPVLLDTAGGLIRVGQCSFVSDLPGKSKKEKEKGLCRDTLFNLIRQSKKTIDLQSPYFIMTDEGKRVITEAVQRGVKVRLLTNSMASTDNYEAFSGYQRDRKAVLKLGVMLYEFKPDAKVRYHLMIPEVQKNIDYKPVYGFHSKTLIIDGVVSVVGSYNFDPRSAHYNTECLAVIRSKEAAEELSVYVEEEFKEENAWKVTKDWNPDHKAGLKKRLKTFWKRIIPKGVL